jgi:hypothetical protein
MEKEKLEIVLEDILDELKTVNNLMHEQKQQTSQMQQRFFAFEEKINQLNEVTTPVVETKFIQDSINAAVNKMQLTVSELSRPVIRQWRFLLFPEHNAKEYYSVIFRLIMWMTFVCMGVYLFALGKQSLESAKEVKLMQLENDQYKHAWEYMYDHESKKGKKKMEDAWQKSRERKQ